MPYNARLSRLSRLSFALACGALLGICVQATADTLDPATTPDALAPTPAQAMPADTSPAVAPDNAKTPANHGENTIELRGVARPDDIPYRSFVAAMRTFEQYHHYAPDAPLLFSLHTHEGKLDGLRISITGEQVWIPVPVSAEGRFTLPIRQDALDDKAVVLSNLHNGEVNWGTVVRTPGLPDGTLRLGDLRLDCRVNNALSREQTSLWVLSLTRLFGGCNSDGRMIRSLKRPGMRVKLSYPGREEILPDRYYIAHHTKWTMPLTDGDWPDDTLVQFLEPDSNFVLDKACADKLQHDAQNPYTHGSSVISASGCAYLPPDD